MEGTSETLSDQEKIERLRDIMRPLWKPGFSTLAHGTGLHVADSILQKGLKARNFDLGSTTVPIFDNSQSYENQPDAIFDNILHWPHHHYKCLVIIQIPNPAAHERGGLGYFNRVLEEMPAQEKVEVGVQGADSSYIIQKKYIQGYIDVENLVFVENPQYDDTAKLSPSNPNKRLKMGLPPTPEKIQEGTSEAAKQVIMTEATDQDEAVW